MKYLLMKDCWTIIESKQQPTKLFSNFRLGMLSQLLPMAQQLFGMIQSMQGGGGGGGGQQGGGDGGQQGGWYYFLTLR